jgi:hypothetical protein
MWVACPNQAQCDGSVEVEVETWTDGEGPWSLTRTIGNVVPDDGRHCDRGCELTEAQLADVCEAAAEDSLVRGQFEG